MLDEHLGIVSGSTFVPTVGEPWLDPTYHLYDDQTLEPYQRFFRALEQSMFLDAQLLEESDDVATEAGKN